jgi:methylenetetrahydrofolate--tRNA-(uracil-5-)-methyltransferase
VSVPEITPDRGARVLVAGAGLAGAEAAWQLASRGVAVELREMRPGRSGPAHETDLFAELVCSNSLRGAALGNAVGLLKEELRRLGSLVLDAADRTAVPAGRALAVDRRAFAELITERLSSHPLVEVARRELTAVPSRGPAIVATGPLTSEALAADLAALTGAEGLHCYDAIAPVVDAESLDLGVLFGGSRYEGGDDYLNVPLDRDQYALLVRDLLEAEKVPPRDFEEPRYFEGCLPVEVLAERGPETLAHGPLKPVGLVDPRTGRRPFAVVQLRREDRAGTAYNIVGFQTRMKQGEQLRVLRRLPGLSAVRLLRYGSVHRNTFVDAPRALTPTLELRARPGVRLAGQITGVEGYVESAACGLLAALFTAAEVTGRPLPPPPAETAHGGLLWHLRGGVSPGGGGRFEPSNVIWAMMPPPPRRRDRADRRLAAAERALAALDRWVASWPEELRPGPRALSGCSPASAGGPGADPSPPPAASRR